MTAKAARKLLRKYAWSMNKHNSGVSSAPAWMLRLWKKSTQASFK